LQTQAKQKSLEKKIFTANHCKNKICLEKAMKFKSKNLTQKVKGKAPIYKKICSKI
jgi:hypothetical protein